MSMPNLFLTNTNDNQNVKEERTTLNLKLSEDTTFNNNITNITNITPASFLPTIKNKHTLSNRNNNKQQLSSNYSGNNTLSRSKSNINGGLFHYFKANLDIMRDEADDIINSLLQIRAKPNKIFIKKNHSSIKSIPAETLNLKAHSRQLPSYSNSITVAPSILKDNRRIRKFIVYPYELKKKIGFYPKLDILKYNKSVVNSLQFQKIYFRDELNVFIDNYLNFKVKYPDNLLINDLFPILNTSSQKRINKIIEEIISLIMEIPFFILGNFYNNVIDFIGRAPPILDKYNNQKVTNETWCLKHNIELLATVFSFLQSSLEMYLDLFGEVTPNELLISYENFLIAKGYMERMRYNLNTIMEVVDMHIKNYKSDNETIMKMENVLRGKSHKENIKKRTGEQSIKNIMAGVVISRTEENEKMFRLNSVLNANKDKNKEGKEEKAYEKYSHYEKYDCERLMKLRKHKSILESPLIDGLYPFFDKNLQEKILALKSHQRHLSLYK